MLSISTIDDTSRSACKTMKMLSKQMMILNASLKKDDNLVSLHCEEIYKVLSNSLSSLRGIQNSLLKLGVKIMDSDDTKKIEEDIGELEKNTPKCITVTLKEYTFLNAVFLEYIKIQTNSSDEYSLFSSPNSSDNLVLKNGST